jgi:hypothetical protein
VAELGKIEKPEADKYTGKRKLYCIPNVYPIEQAPDDYKELVDRFWDDAAMQIEKLEAAGKIKKIFCENIHVGGQEALDTLGKMNEKSFQIVRKKIEDGAVLVPVESEEIFGPYMDWTNCLGLVRTKEVFNKVFEFYSELSEKRLKHARDTIEDNLSEGEAAMLIMRDEDRMRLQLPQSIEVFLVIPPSYDDILRWFRDKMHQREDESGETGQST